MLPLVRPWNKRHATSDNVPRNRFSGEAKSGAPEPPANVSAPVESSEKPIEVTTTAETIGPMKRRQYFASRPSTNKMRPPAMTDPMTVP